MYVQYNKKVCQQVVYYTRSDFCLAGLNLTLTFNLIAHFRNKLVEYLDYYSNRRIKNKAKGITRCPQAIIPFYYLI